MEHRPGGSVSGVQLNPFISSGPHVARMAFAMKQDEALDPEYGYLYSILSRIDDTCSFWQVTLLVLPVQNMNKFLYSMGYDFLI